MPARGRASDTVTRVLQTGAAGGIGAAASAALRQQGARVVGLDLHGDHDADAPLAAELAARLRA